MSTLPISKIPLFPAKLGTLLFYRLYPIGIALLGCVSAVKICQSIPEAVILLGALLIVYHVVAIPLHHLTRQLLGLIARLPTYQGHPSLHSRLANLLAFGILALLAIGAFIIVSASLYPIVTEQYVRLLASAPEYYISLVTNIKQALINTPFEPIIQVLDTYLPLSPESLAPESLDGTGWLEPTADPLTLPPLEPDTEKASFSETLLGIDDTTPLGHWLQWTQQTLSDSWHRIISLISASVSGFVLFILGVVLLITLLIDAKPFQNTAVNLIPVSCRDSVTQYCQFVNALIHQTVCLQWVSVIVTTAIVYGVLLTFWVGYTEALTVFWAICSLFPLIGLWFGSLGLFIVLVSTQHWGAIATLVIALGIFQYVKARWVVSSWAASTPLANPQQRIHPLVLLLSFAVGIALLGLGGLFVMVPLGAALTIGYEQRVSAQQAG